MPEEQEPIAGLIPTPPSALEMTAADINRKPVTFTQSAAGLRITIGNAQPVHLDRWNAATIASFFRSV